MSPPPRPTAPLALTALLALALLLPSAQAADTTPGITNPDVSTPTKLYFHVGANQDFPINTQEPPADAKTRDDSYGSGTNSLTCLPAGTPADGFTQKRYTTYYGFSSPGYVEYNYTIDGSPRIHPERGLSFDVKLDGAVQPVVRWYITTFAGADVNGVHADPIIPNVVARATVRTGEKITLDDKGYNDGEIIAQGQTDPTTLLAGQKAVKADGSDNPQVSVDKGDPGTASVYGFAIPLTYAKTVIPKDSGYSIRIDLFVVPAPGVCDMSSDDKYAMPSMVKTHTDPKHRPRMDLAVMNAIRIEYMHPQFVGDDLVLHTSENSPWGNYDVDERMGGITLSIAGPNGPVNGVYRAAVVQRTHEHDHHTQAVDVTFVWPYKQVNAADGLYTVSLEVLNDQGTATAKGIAQFQVGKEATVTECGAQGLNAGAEAKSSTCVVKSGTSTGGPAKASPDMKLAGLVSALAAVAFAVRRRL